VNSLSVLKQERVVVNRSITASAALKLCISDPLVTARGGSLYKPLLTEADSNMVSMIKMRQLWYFSKVFLLYLLK
jgi:hypothetical protein